MNKVRIKGNKSDVIFDIVNYILLTAVMLLVLYPLYFIVIASISDPNAIYEGKVYFIPKLINFEGYERIFAEKSIWRGYLNTFIYTSVGTAINVLFTICAAYSLSKKYLPGRNFFMLMITFTMFFSGGLIPAYLLVQKMGMLNSIWGLVIPTAVGPWNLIIARTFFQSNIPDEVCEAASIDGSSEINTFIRIVLPISQAIIAIMILFYAVGHWNSYFNALIYLRSEDKYPLQLILRSILVQNEVNANMVTDESALAEKQRIADLIKYGVIIVSSLPVLILYPFVQKYFVQGVMIGSVKG